jgi:hypothetical protein
MRVGETSGLCYKSFTIVIYDHSSSTIVIYDRNESGQYYKTVILAKAEAYLKNCKLQS